jgi:succinate dehydrogenase/fumarate reductase-like Fe-S protein
MSTMAEQSVIVNVERFDPRHDSEPRWERFEVPYEERHSVLTLLNYIYANYDRTLGYRNYQCGRGICDSCRVSINGKVGKGCATPIQPGAEVTLRPCSKYIIKDLATVLVGGPAEPAILEEWRAEAANGAAGNG